MVCKTYASGELKEYKYVVILSQYDGKILLSRHKERTTWETQGGHIEQGETPLQAAKRELYEESGAVQYEIAPLCDYWAGESDMVKGAGGVVFVARIKQLGSIPESEMQEVKTFASLPENITYPSITPVLFETFENIEKDIKEYESVELWDTYQLDGAVTGTTITRGEEIPDGLFHAVAEIFVVHEDGTILLMKRDTNKSNYPGFWESGAGGAILKGESYTLGARRELYEETGIIAEELENIYTSYFKDRFYKGYLCRTNSAKNSIRLQEGETIDYKWVDKTEFLEIYESDEFVASKRDRLRTFVNNNIMTEKDCCFEKDKYWFRYRAAAIIIEDNCVLMAKNDIDDYYYSIGGGIHLGETSEQAVCREVREETGIDYEIDHLAFINESLFYGHGVIINGKECHVIEFYYLMKSKGKKIFREGDVHGTVLGGTPEHLHWIPLEEFGEKKAFPEFFKNKLMNMPDILEHIVSDERK